MEKQTNLYLYCHFFLDSAKGVVKTIKIRLDSLDIPVIQLKAIIAKALENQKETSAPLFKVLAISQEMNTPILEDTAKLNQIFNHKDDVFCQVEMNIQPIKTSILKPEDNVLKYKSLTTYSFWEANKQIVKVSVPLKGVENLPKENIKANFTESSLDVKVLNLDGVNYHFGVPRLDAKIVPEKSEVQVDKQGNLIIKLRKFKEDDHWTYLFKQKYVGENL